MLAFLWYLLSESVKDEAIENVNVGQHITDNLEENVGIKLDNLEKVRGNDELDADAAVIRKGKK